MARELVDDALWEIIEPLLPPPPPRKTPAGRKRLDERRVLTGILFILHPACRGKCCPRRWDAARA